MTKLISLLLLASPAFGGWALIDHTETMISAGANGGTSSDLNSSGATLLLASIPALSQSAAAVTVSDSNGNTWHSRTNQTLGSNNTAIWYAYDHGGAALVVGAGQSFTVSCTGCFSGMAVSAWSGNTPGVDPYDGVEGGGGSAASPLTVSPITPTQNGELIFTSLVETASGLVFITLNSPFTKMPVVASVGTLWYSAGYLVQTTATPVGPTWNDFSGGANLASAVAAFRVAPPPGPSNNTVSSGVSSAGVGR